MKPQKIKKIKALGSKPTIDIEINNKSHLFYANGLATSNSHAVAYAHLSYATAYAKAHFPHRFFRSYLDHSAEKQKPLEEINRLVIDAKKNGVSVLPPDIRLRNKDFSVQNNKIYFGLSHIKSIGSAAFDKILEGLPKDFDGVSWNRLLLKHLVNMPKSAVKILLCSGAFDFVGLPRKEMLFYHDKICSLKVSELEYLRTLDIDNISLLKCLENLTQVNTGKGRPISTKRRLVGVLDVYKSIKNPPFSLKDSIEELAAWEETYLGISITCSRFDVIQKSGAETYCGNFEKEFDKKFVVIGQVKHVREILTKNGDEMAFCSLCDDSGEIESVVIFPEKWAQYQHIISNMDIVRCIGYKSEDSFILTFCEEVKSK